MTEPANHNNATRPRSTNSLTLKLLAPILIAALIIMVAIGLFTWHVGQKYIEDDIQTETNFITDTLIISAETSGSRSSLMRVVNSLAADPNIDRLSVIHLNSGKIVADNHNQLQGQLAELVMTSSEREAVQHHIISKKAQNIRHHGTHFQLSKTVMLLDPQINRLRPHIIFLDFNTSHAQREAKIHLFEILTIYLAGLVCMLLVFQFILQRAVIKPIHNITRAIEQQHDQRGEAGTITVTSNDEIGLLTQTYNRLNQEKHNQTQELEKTRHYVDGITHSAPALLAYIDCDLRYQFVNDVFEHWFKVKPSFFVGKTLVETVTEKMYAELKPRVDLALTGKITSFNTALPTPDGGERFVKITYTPDLHPTTRETVGLFLAVEDITAIKNQTEMLRELTLRLEVAIEATGFGVWDYDIHADILLWDARMYELSGTSPETFPNAKDAWEQTTHPEDLPQLQAIIKNAILTGEPFITYYRVVTPDGIRHMQGHAKVIGNDDGRNYRVIGSCLDITELTRAEIEASNSLRAQQETAARIEAILDSAADAIITIDEYGTIQAFNRAAEKIFGYNTEEAIGNNVSMLMPQPHQDQHPMYLERHIQTHESAFFGRAREFMGLKKNGDLFPLLLSVTEVQVDSGILFTGLIRDISQEKTLEQEREAALQKAQESAQLKSAFLASMSHEIRTPMNGVIGMLDLLLKGDMNDKQHHYAKLARASADSLLVLINDILDFSKIEAGKLNIENIPFNLRMEYGQFAEAIAHKAQEKGLEFIWDVSGVDVDSIVSDPSRIRQILANLISNAIKFTESGQVMVKLWLDREHTPTLLRGQISDTGIGIPEKKCNTLFDVFTQVDASTTRKYGGTGLGLAITKQLSQMMGGDTKVTSTLGQGSTFEFSAAAAISAEAKAIKPPFAIDHIRLLIVDDNHSNAQCLQNQLSLWGASVTVAHDGAAALSALDQATPPFHTVLIDRDMPQQDGFALAAEIHQRGHLDSQLILMVPQSATATKDYYHNLGFTTHFPKPATTVDLFAALATVLGEEDALTSWQSRATIIRNEQVAGENVCILLVEDNPINQEVALGLMEDFNLTVTVADNGQAALHTLQESETVFDIVLMDCQMPVMDGFETTHAIRENLAGDRYQNIPIIALTANAMKGDREHCLAAGMSDYLSKPIDANELQRVLNHWSQTPVVEITHQEIDKDKETAAKTDTATPAEEDEQNPIWDKPAALQRVRNKPERLAQLIELFLRDMPARVDELQSSIVAKDLKEIAFIAHTIKGVSGNLSGLRLHQVAAELEAAAKNEDEPAISTLWPQLEKNYSQLQNQLRQFH